MTSEQREAAILKRYNDLQMSFYIQNTLLLKDGRCACVSCQKQFYNSLFLQNHFQKVHQNQLNFLHEKAESDVAAGFNTPLQRVQQDVPHFDMKESPKDSEEPETTLQRVEKRAYADLAKEDDSKEISYEPYVESRQDAYL